VKILAAIIMMAFLVSASVSEAASIRQLKKVEQMKNEVNELFKEGQYRSAIPILERIISINPTDRTAARYLRIARQHEIEPYCKRADDAFMRGEYETAINEWQEILKLSPEDTRVEKMIELTRNLIHDNILESMYALVDKFMKEEDFVGAANELEKILMLQPDERRARELLISTQQAITNARIKSLYEKAERHMKIATDSFRTEDQAGLHVHQGKAGI
jgi:tetratricopeptide (TPR) repeat protein